jgi:hypothetical protein
MATFEIPITKAGKRLISIDTGKDTMPDEVFRAVVFEGLKHFANLGTSKLKKDDFAKIEDFEAAAWEVAQAQVAKMYAGDIRKRSAAPKVKGAGIEMTEALRLAKLSAKEQYKVLAATDKTLPRMSHIPAKQWTESAKAMIQADPDTWLAAARESLARTRSGPPIDKELFAGLKADPKKVAAAKAKAKKAPAAPVVPAKGKGKGKGATATA